MFAQVPAHAYVHISVGEPLARAKAQAGDGWIPPAKVPVIAKEVLRQCDALDGIEDGLVSNYIACNRKFDPATTRRKHSAAVRCAGGADTGRDMPIGRADSARPMPCTVRSTIPSRSTRAGRRLPDGRPAASRPRTGKRCRRGPRPASNFGVLRSRIVRDANANLLDVDLATYAKELQQLSAVIDATDPDLSAFRRRGGKLIMKVNTTDYTVNPRWVMDYYDKVRADDGRGRGERVRAFLRRGRVVPQPERRAESAHERARARLRGLHRACSTTGWSRARRRPTRRC